jgi:PST family polysaccharide transporter
MIAAIASAVVAIALAARGAGAWSFVWSQITFSIVSALLTWSVSPWRPKLIFSRASLREVGGYSSKVFGWNFLFYMNRKADNMLIGRYLGAAPLGLYSVAYNIMLFPFQQIATPI